MSHDNLMLVSVYTAFNEEKEKNKLNYIIE